MSELQRYHIGRDSKLYRDGSIYPTSGDDAFILADEAQVRIDVYMAARRELQERLAARDAEIDQLREALYSIALDFDDWGDTIARYTMYHVAKNALQDTADE